MKALKKLIEVAGISICFLLAFQGYAQVKQDQVLTLKDSLPNTIGGIAVDQMGYIYVADFQETVWQINPNGNARVFATGLYGASGNSFDVKGHLFQANFYGNYISKITRNGTVSVYADSLLAGPVGIAINATNDLFVCNCLTPSITKISPDGQASIFVQSDLLRCANGITADSNGNFYVVNFYNNNVVKVTSEGKASLLAKTPGKVGNGHITLANGLLYVTAVHDHQVYRITLDGKVSLFAGTGERGGNNGDAIASSFSSPNGIAVSPDHKKLYINDYKGDIIHPNPKEDHMRVRVIELASLADIIKSELLTNGEKSARVLYSRLKKSPRYSGENTQAQMYTIGTDLIRLGEFDLAIAALNMNLESYPQDVGSYASIGWAYGLMDNRKEAIRAYEKALSMSPSSETLRARLNQLRN